MDEGSTSSVSSGSDGGSLIGSVTSTPSTPQRLPFLSSAAIQTPASSPLSSLYSISPPGTPASMPSLLSPLTEAISARRLSEEPTYEAKTDVPYNARSIDTIIPASLARYNLSRLNNKNFLLVRKSVDDNTNTYVAITPAIEIGKQFSCVADYFNGTNLQSPSNSRTNSPISPTSPNILRINELWQELRPLFSQNELVIKILYPYTTSESSWVIGEIVITKNADKYQVDFSVYDPLGNAKLEPLDHQGIKEHVTQEIRKINNSAILTPLAREKRITMLAPDDIVPSGVMAIELLLSLAAGIDFQQITQNPPLHFRNLHLQAVMAYYDIEQSAHRRRFISTYARLAAQSERSLVNHSSESRVIVYGVGTNKYLPLFTEAQEQDLIQRGNSVAVKNVNLRAAFYAAQTGNKLLLEALLGPEIDEEATNEKLESLAKEAYALSQDRREIHFKIAIIEMQTKLIGIYLEKPELDRSPKLLKQLIEDTIDKIASEFSDAYITDHLGARADEKVMFNMRLLKMNDLSSADVEALKSAFRDRLLTYKAKFLTEFNPQELSTIHTNLFHNQEALLKSYEEMHKTITQRNMESATLDNLLKDKLNQHRGIVGRFWKLRRATLPDFYPKDEFSYWLHMLCARVPIEVRDQLNNYNTLLHVSWLHGHINVAHMLIRRGANPESKNNLQQTPDQLNGSKHTFQALIHNAHSPVYKESEFVRLLKGLCAKYLIELTEQQDLCRGNHGLWGAFARNFIDPELIAARKKTLDTLTTLIEFADAESNDALLAKWIFDLLKAHYDAKFVHIKDALPIKGTDFFDKLSTIYNSVITKPNDYGAIRLPRHLEKYLLANSAYIAQSKLVETQTQLARKEEENERLKAEVVVANQKVEQETKLRMDLEQQLEEERRRRIALENITLEQKRKENEELRRITQAPEAPSASPLSSGSIPPAIIASGPPKTPPLGANSSCLFSASNSSPAQAASPLQLLDERSASTIEMQTFSNEASDGKSPQAPK